MFTNPRPPGVVMSALCDLRQGERAVVVSVSGEPALVQRLYEFGMLEGEKIELIAVAPLADPIEIRVGNTRLSLRRSEAAGISVQRI